MMIERKTLTTENGAPVSDNQQSQTAGPQGPVLLQDHHLLEKLARFDRERIPERVVHARGSGAHGYFELTRDVSQWTKAKFLTGVGKRTDVFIRFSTVALERGSADTVRDPRGFALKFYTEDGNYDLVGNGTPIFFIRDPLKFPDFIHSQKRDPFTNMQEPENAWDFFSHSPEATHQFTWLFGDRGIPASLRHLDGFGSHTFQWLNAKGEAFWVKYHFKTDQGIKCLTSEQAARIGGENPDHHHQDLLESIERKQFPSWTVKMQIMPVAEAPHYRFNPFDLTKVWYYKDYPLIEIGKLVLNRNPDNYFAEVEQAAFTPANFVPGIGPSPDKMLQGRLFSYGDTQRYRLGINHTHLPINRPRHPAANYGRDGAMRGDGNGGRSANYEPNSRGGPVQSNEPGFAPLEIHGLAGPHPWPKHPEDTDFVQAGALYRVMKPEERLRLIANIAGNMAKVKNDDVVARSIGHFRAADADYGARVEAAVREIRKR